uniref:ABC transporter domain-containing protein n=1 Tax=Salix viminalis TaxID=40686 RepID=A0A6N2MC25_SALVM
MPMYNGVAEAPRGNSPDGPDQSKGPPPRDSRDLPSLMLSSCYPITLKFMDVGYKVKFENRNKGSNIKRVLGCAPKISDQTQERTILNGITGMASPGEILAILGPSGSGKSTFLNALAGRIQSSSFTGTILANSRKPTKQIMKRTGFVTQDDILYPHLTVRETLVFCSLLRLPESLSKQEKTLVAESVISELGLTKCENTIIGNSFIRGISGGERKRVSIAHEMLINPSLLILDEPLQVWTRLRLTDFDIRFACTERKDYCYIHSSTFKQSLSNVRFSSGRGLYFGKGSEAMSYFQSTGYSPSFPMNPADFLLDLANGVCQTDGASEREKPNVKQSLIASYNTLVGSEG